MRYYEIRFIWFDASIGEEVESMESVMAFDKHEVVSIVETEYGCAIRPITIEALRK